MFPLNDWLFLIIPLFIVVVPLLKIAAPPAVAILLEIFPLFITKLPSLVT